MPEDTEDNEGDRVNERQGIMPEDTGDNIKQVKAIF